MVRLSALQRRIGQLLEFDEAAIHAIYMEEDRNGAEACCKLLFRRWLEGAGVQPVTWGRLLGVLDRSMVYIPTNDIYRTLTA